MLQGIALLGVEQNWTNRAWISPSSSLWTNTAEKQSSVEKFPGTTIDWKCNLNASKNGYYQKKVMVLYMYYVEMLVINCGIEILN